MTIFSFVVVVGLAIEVMRLRRHLHLEDFTPTEKWRAAISGDRYLTKSFQDVIPPEASKQDLEFFRTFRGLADYLNALYADGPWSFQDNGKPRCSSFAESSSREIEIRYNQQKTGFVEVSCIDFGKSDAFGAINIKLELLNARFFEGHDVFRIAQTLVMVVSDKETDLARAEAAILRAMIHAMWQIGPEAIGNPQLEFSTTGQADWYRSTRWAIP